MVMEAEKKYQVAVRNYEQEGLSKITMSLIMDYEDWKKHFAENLKRYDAEKQSVSQ